jgi:hypothetical protein
MKTWTAKRYENNITGETRTVYRKVVADFGGRHIYVEVYERGGRFYWSANIRIANRPDLSRMAYGTYAAIPGALSVAKARASRIAGNALRAA